MLKIGVLHFILMKLEKREEAISLQDRTHLLPRTVPCLEAELFPFTLYKDYLVVLLFLYHLLLHWHQAATSFKR